MTSKKSSSHPPRIAEIRVSYRPKIRQADRPKISSSSSALKFFRQKWDKSSLELIEQFKVMLLNRSCLVLGIFEHSAGNMHASVVDAQLILATALKARASGIILAHNHPSGEPRPSRADIELTNKIKKMAKIFDLCLHDHIILCHDSYFSFADEGVF